MASGQNKPDGQFVITPKNGPAFVEQLPIKKFHGVIAQEIRAKIKAATELSASAGISYNKFLARWLSPCPSGFR